MKNYKRILSVAFVLVMALCVLSVSAFAADPVAKIGEQSYATLQEAIDAAVAGDNLITLTADCDEEVTIRQASGVNIVIDGANNTYSGTFKINGDARAEALETLTIKNINFSEEETTYGDFIYADNQAHNLTVDSCSFKSNNWHRAFNTKHISSMTVTNCTADTVYYFIYNSQAGQKLTVKNCTVTKATYGIGSQKCIETYIENYTYTGKAAGIYGRASANASTLTMKNVDVTTTLSNQSALMHWKNNDKTTSKNFQYIFVGDNNKFTTVEGTNWFKTQSTSNAPYEFIQKYEVAQIGDVAYYTLKEAVDAAQSGDIITLIDDITLTAADASTTKVSGMYPLVSVLDKAVTIDLNGKKITVCDLDLDANLLAVFHTGNTGELTLKDSSEAKTGTVDVTMEGGTQAYSMFTALGNSKMYIESGNYSIDKVEYGQSMIYAGQDKQITVTGGTFYLGDALTRTAPNGQPLPWIFNTHGDGQKVIVVTGGNFNVDPTHYHGEANFPGCYGPHINENGTYDIYIVHTPGAAATCQAPQTCTVCGIELDSQKVCEFVNYVSDNNATCTADGTKTAECIYVCGAKHTVADEGSILDHTPGAAATCMAPQTCTGCGIELDAQKACEFVNYVSDNNATCTADGTKTAECIYGCGATHTAAVKGSKLPHNDADADQKCDSCGAGSCTICGKIHDTFLSEIFCLFSEFIRLVSSFFKNIF